MAAEPTLITPPARRYGATIALLTLAVLLWQLGALPLLSENEGRRAAVIQTMHASGDWLVPRLNGEVYVDKPPLHYWLGLAVAHLRGAADAWAVRLPSALAALALLAGLHAAVRRQTPSASWAATFAVLALLCNVGFSMFGRRAEIDMLFAALAGGAWLAASHWLLTDRRRRWLDLAYALLGLALLTKGPVALLFFPAPLLGHYLFHRQRAALEALGHWRGWALALLIALPWYAVVTAKLGAAVWAPVAATDLAGKAYGMAFDPPWDYLLWLLGDFAPLSLIVLATPRASWRAVAGHAGRPAAPVRPAAAAADAVAAGQQARQVPAAGLSGRRGADGPAPGRFRCRVATALAGHRPGQPAAGSRLGRLLRLRRGAAVPLPLRGPRRTGRGAARSARPGWSASRRSMPACFTTTACRSGCSTRQPCRPRQRTSPCGW